MSAVPTVPLSRLVPSFCVKRRHALASMLPIGLGVGAICDMAWGEASVPNDPLFALQRASDVLAALAPPTSLNKLESGNELLLEVADVVRNGEVVVKAMSVMPRTRKMWLLTLAPDPRSDERPGSALLAKFDFAPGEPPQAQVTVALAATQTLLLVAQASGQYFGVRREVKVGFDDKMRAR